MLGATDAFGGTLDTGGGHVHPLNFALGLALAAGPPARAFLTGRVATVIPGDPHEVRLRGWPSGRKPVCGPKSCSTPVTAI